ncbi:MAG: hypothetical protein AAF267_25200, partial [Deinococcota bacterium]
MMNKLDQVRACLRKLRSVFGLVLIVVLSGFWFTPTPRLEQGIMDLRTWNFGSDGVVNLIGEAEFYWQQLLTPRDFAEHSSRVGQSLSPGTTASLGTPERFSNITTDPSVTANDTTETDLDAAPPLFTRQPTAAPSNDGANMSSVNAELVPSTNAPTASLQTDIQLPRRDGYIAIPKPWNDFQVNGQPIGGDGYGTYRFQIQLAQRVDQLALNVPEVDSAYVLYINGQLRASNGRVGRDPTETRAEWLPQLVTLEGNSTSLDIVLQVSNFE